VIARSVIFALAVLFLALFPAGALADSYEITYEPASPVATEPVSFHAVREPGKGGPDTFAWAFGDGGTADGRNPAHVYAAPGTYEVTLTITDASGASEEADPVEVVVGPAPEPPNAPPSATFTFSPLTPVVSELISFTGGSDSDGFVATRLWDFGDGATSSASEPTHAYADAGTYPVALTVTDDDGAFASTSQNVTVQPRPQDPPPDDGTPPGDGTPPDNGTPPDSGSVITEPVGGSAPGGTPIVRTPAPTPPAMMRPFPVVRIAGLVLPSGAAVRILSVRTALGSTVRVRCQGSGCPVASMARTAAVRLVRLHRFERRLPAGTRLELFVRQRGKIGKYTRFAIRAGKPPARVDRCLMPGRARPVPCS